MHGGAGVRQDRPEPLRGIVVGLGPRGLSWVEAGLRHPGVRWVGGVSRSARNRAAGQAAGLAADRLYPSVEGALAILAGGADFVLDATPPAAREEVAAATFAAGLHLLSEKPLADDMATARRIVAAGLQAGRRHMVAQNYRFKPQPRTTRPLLERGVIGPVGQLDVVFAMPWADSPGSHYVTEPHMFITDMGIHHFDTMRYVLGREPLGVRCVAWQPAWDWHAAGAAHVAIFRFGAGAGDLHAVHRATGCALGTQTALNGDWRLEGPGGTLTWESDDIFLTHLHRTERPRREQVFLERVPAPHMAILDEFVAAVRAERDPECNARDNLRSLAMTAACIQSARTGGAEVSLVAPPAGFEPATDRLEGGSSIP
jgi:predicted dehydrogenase